MIMSLRSIGAREWHSLRVYLTTLLINVPPDTFVGNTFLRPWLASLMGMDCRHRCSISKGCFYHAWQISVGEGTRIARDSYLDAFAPIVIGGHVSIGSRVSIATASHEYGPATARGGMVRPMPVRIGDGCWVGASVFIGPGVEIGAGSVISAGAVVLRSMPANCLVAGNPARPIRRLDSDSETSSVPREEIPGL